MTIRVLEGDCRNILRTLEGRTVQTCVTSPPYYGLRDYGVEGQIGLEETPEQFIAQLVDVFREVRNVLRDDGTLWLNIGDSYAGTGKSGGGAQGARWEECGADTEGPRGGKWKPAPVGTKQKDLIGIPWMLAFALRADGWYLRQDIIWHKPNPMPESVKDRCTKAHEYLFLLTKSARYYFDADAIAEQATGQLPGNVNAPKGQAAYEAGDEKQRTKAGLSAFAERARSKRDSFKREGSKREQPIPGQSVGTHRPDREESDWDTGKRNKRSVWTVATQPFKEAHFATFPPALIEPCILAGSKPGDLVLDPFGGAGTTGLVADRLQRDAILIELNAEYAGIAKRRISADSPLFTHDAVSAA